MAVLVAPRATDALPSAAVMVVGWPLMPSFRVAPFGGAGASGDTAAEVVGALSAGVSARDRGRVRGEVPARGAPRSIQGAPRQGTTSAERRASSARRRRVLTKSSGSATSLGESACLRGSTER